MKMDERVETGDRGEDTTSHHVTRRLHGVISTKTLSAPHLHPVFYKISRYQFYAGHSILYTSPKRLLKAARFLSL